MIKTLSNEIHVRACVPCSHLSIVGTPILQVIGWRMTQSLYDFQAEEC